MNRFYVFCAGCGVVLSGECFFSEDTASLFCEACAPEGSEKVELEPAIKTEVIIVDDVGPKVEWRLLACIGVPEHAEWTIPQEVTA